MGSPSSRCLLAYILLEFKKWSYLIRNSHTKVKVSSPGSHHREGKVLKEIESFEATELNGKRYTVQCFQASKSPEAKLFKTAEGVFLKAINDFTFNILGSGRVLYRQQESV